MTSPEERLSLLAEYCRERGVPMTAQRRAVFEKVLTHKDHPTAERIYEEVQTVLPQTSRATVYRALDTLVEANLVKRIAHPEARTRFDPVTEPHNHLICETCGRVEDLENSESLPDPDLFKIPGWETKQVSILVCGLCPSCRPGSEPA